ncbi:membrane metalloprotease [Altibacter sp. HG106]|uniref:membrane metalloprotease n=1 Tax=Altibacter sp. HG106 TaxID=3023937 RepID=UPI0023502F94|nr:membrane metalloprotease [Altibacter sp. HG106]MDC7996119.1 membrane metalloprotease [Altibacter sp. HG106]
MTFPKFLLLMLSAAVLITSCKDDDNNDTPPQEDPTAENKKALGESAEDLLANETYDRMVVEFVYSEGFRPMQETIDGFQTFLQNRLNKPGGVVFVETVIDPPPGAPYNSTEIREIEEANRTQFTTDDTIAVYVFFSDGSSFGDSSNSVTLGTAYRNTSMVVYEKTLRDISSSTTLPVLEATTLHHEMGHILGLVNISEDDIHTEHEDEFRAKHCFVEECLMYFDASGLTKSEVARFLERRAQAPNFDPLCIEDLQAKGGK